MNFTKVTIETLPDGLDLLVAELEELGITGVEQSDPQELDSFLRGAGSHFDYVDQTLGTPETLPCTASVYLAQNEQGAQQLDAIHALLKSLHAQFGEACFGTLACNTKTVAEEDWANNWKQYFKPIEIGNTLVVCPTWEQYENPQGRAVMRLDPASAFGTGTHATTRLCLEQLEQTVHPGDRVLDLGCGSGILSLGALLLGAASITGVDIDQNSVRVSQENMEQNGIDAARYRLCQGDITANPMLRKDLGTGYDLVVANIVADVLIAMAPLFRGFLRQGGTLLVSGIIGPRAEEVKNAIVAQGFSFCGETLREDWACQQYTA